MTSGLFFTTREHRVLDSARLRRRQGFLLRRSDVGFGTSSSPAGISISGKWIDVQAGRAVGGVEVVFSRAVKW